MAKKTKQGDPFYSSSAWKRLRRIVLLQAAAASPTGRAQCQIEEGCTNVADCVDHIVSRRVDPYRGLDITNLRPGCRSCNSRRVMVDLVAESKRAREGGAACPPAVRREW